MSELGLKDFLILAGLVLMAATFAILLWLAEVFSVSGVRVLGA